MATIGVGLIFHCVAAPADHISNWYSYGYNDDTGVDGHEQYAKCN